MMVRFLLSMSLVILIAGCGGKSPLDEAQKEQLMQTAKSLGNVTTSVKEADRRNAARNVLNQLAKVVDAKSGDDRTEKMIASLESGDHCNLDVKVEGSLASVLDFSAENIRGMQGRDQSQSFKVAMKASGDRCPVTMDLSLNLDLDSEGVAGDFKWDYAVVDEEYRKLNDIDSLSLSGDFDIKVSVEYESQTISGYTFEQPVAMSVNGSAKIEGDIHSQEEGDIRFYLRVDANGDMDAVSGSGEMKTEMVLGLEYPEFTGEFKVVHTENSEGESMEFTLNGEEITEEEFQEYIEATSATDFTGEN